MSIMLRFFKRCIDLFYHAMILTIECRDFAFAIAMLKRHKFQEVSERLTYLAPMTTHHLF